jgi:hypothetical protein
MRTFFGAAALAAAMSLAAAAQAYTFSNNYADRTAT